MANEKMSVEFDSQPCFLRRAVEEQDPAFHGLQFRAAPGLLILGAAAYIEYANCLLLARKQAESWQEQRPQATFAKSEGHAANSPLISQALMQTRDAPVSAVAAPAARSMRLRLPLTEDAPSRQSCFHSIAQCAQQRGRRPFGGSHSRRPTCCTRSRGSGFEDVARAWSGVFRRQTLGLRMFARRYFILAPSFCWRRTLSEQGCCMRIRRCDQPG